MERNCAHNSKLLDTERVQPHLAMGWEYFRIRLGVLLKDKRPVTPRGFPQRLAYHKDCGVKEANAAMTEGLMWRNRAEKGICI